MILKFVELLTSYVQNISKHLNMKTLELVTLMCLIINLRKHIFIKNAFLFITEIKQQSF